MVTIGRKTEFTLVVAKTTGITCNYQRRLLSMPINRTPSKASRSISLLVYITLSRFSFVFLSFSLFLSPSSLDKANRSDDELCDE